MSGYAIKKAVEANFGPCKQGRIFYSPDDVRVMEFDCEIGQRVLAVSPAGKQEAALYVFYANIGEDER